MHELTLCESILDILDDEQRRRGFVGLKRLVIEIGRFGCVDADALRFALETTTRGTWMAGARFDIARTPGRLHCLDCAADIEVDDRFDLCPRCGGTRLLRIGGDEMRLVEMEVAWPGRAPTTGEPAAGQAAAHPSAEDAACASLSR